MSLSEPPRDRVQFSIGTLMILAVAVAVITPAIQWVWLNLENPISHLASLALGAAIGVAATLALRNVPITPLLIAVLLIFALVNGCWISGGFPAYCCGVAAGAALVWKGIFVLNLALAVCQFTVSTAKRSENQPMDERNLSE